jgi:predicted dehydrogenase
MAAYAGGAVMRVEVSGSLGTATVIDAHNAMWAVPGHPESEREVEPPAASVFEDFARWLRDDAYVSPTLGTPAQAVHAVDIVDALYRSARSRSWEDVPAGL